LSPTFTINFRREIYQRELARGRSRVISLGAWLSYFGALAVIAGLYGLNFAAIQDRTRMMERLARSQHVNQPDQIDWARQPAEMALVERGFRDGSRWRRRLEHLAITLPPHARLESIEFNPGGVSGGRDWNRLVLSGTLKAEPNQDRMQRVADLVVTLQKDSLLAAHFQTIRLTSTRVTETAGTTADFVIECRP
jgi:hypothetical protein